MRLIAFTQGKKLPKGLDDGVRISKSERKKIKLAAEKKNAEGGATVKQEKIEVTGVAKEVPTIRPGERMSDFSARVDAALPVSGLINKTARGGKDPLGLKVGRTKTEKKMHKLYDTWREEERKIQDGRMDALEDAEELAEDSDGQVKWKAEIETASEGKAGKKNKKKRKKMLGEVDDGDEDPWAKIKRDRGEGDVKFGDVVLAPPVFSKVPTEKFKARVKLAEVADVPKASGSLRRREELGEVRRGVVEGYRQMMMENREKAKAKERA